MAFGGLGTLLGPLIGAGVFAILDEQLTTSLELREVLYGVFVVAIFLFFRHGVVNAVVNLYNRLAARRREEPEPQPSGEAEMGQVAALLFEPRAVVRTRARACVGR